MPINFDLLDKFAAATKSTSGQTFAGYIGNGNTSALILFDPKCDPNDPATSGGLFALAYDTFTDKATGVSKRRPKFIVLAIIAAADDPKGLPKGWNGDFSEADSTVKERVGAIKAERMVVPLAISATMKDALIDAIQANLSPVDIDGETGQDGKPDVAHLQLPAGSFAHLFSDVGLVGVQRNKHGRDDRHRYHQYQKGADTDEQLFHDRLLQALAICRCARTQPRSPDRAPIIGPVAVRCDR